MSLVIKFKKIVEARSLSQDPDIVKFIKTLGRAQGRLDWLDCLEAAGVDNWEGLEVAYEMLDDEESDDDE